MEINRRDAGTSYREGEGHWTTRAACADWAEVFEDPGTRARADWCKAKCRACPVKKQCRASLVVTPSVAPDGIVQAGHYWAKGRPAKFTPQRRVA